MLFWRQEMQKNQKFVMLAAIWTDWNGVVDKISFGCSWVHAMFWVEVLFDCSSYAACWLWEIVADARIYLISLPLQKHGCMLWHSKNHFLQQKLNSLLQDKGWLFEWTHVDTSRDTSGMIRSLYKGQGSSAAPPDSWLLPQANNSQESLCSKALGFREFLNQSAKSHP